MKKEISKQAKLYMKTESLKKMREEQRNLRLKLYF